MLSYTFFLLNIAGPFCETDIDECVILPCGMQATCINTPGNYTCTCPPLYTGHDCDVKVDHCALDPCSGHGSCSSDEHGFTCQCDPGWIGNTCSHVDACRVVACHNGGTCINLPLNTYQCDCTLGYEGGFNLSSCVFVCFF